VAKVALDVHGQVDRMELGYVFPHFRAIDHGIAVEARLLVRLAGSLYHVAVAFEAADDAFRNLYVLDVAAGPPLPTPPKGRSFVRG